MIQAGKIYRELTDDRYYRIFSVYPDEDKVVVARIKCSSTRLRLAKLSTWNAALASYQIVPAELEERRFRYSHSEDTKATIAFNKIRPALEILLAPTYAEQAERRIWKDIAREAAKVRVSSATLNWAYSQVLMAGGSLDAAIPQWHRCGRRPSTGKNNYEPQPTHQPGSYNLSVVDFANIAEGVRRFCRDGTPWSDAHDLFLEKFYPASEKEIAGQKIVTPRPAGKRPSLFQFKWHGMRLVSLNERLVLQHGELEVQRNYRGKPNGQSAPGIYPGVVSEIDWTPPDIVGVSRGSRLSIGRFSCYAIADVHSGGIQAAYATMFNGSAAEAGKAILQCLEEKVSLCANSGLKIEKWMWDMDWLPVELRCDKGEINSWKSTGLGTALGMKLEYCVSKRPDQKGTIESFFNVLRWCLRRLRGGTSGMKERLKAHPNITAIYDFDEVQKLLFILTIKFNARVRRRQALTPGMVASAVLPVPNHICAWAKERGCMRDFTIENARIGVLPTHFSTVTSEGIKLKGLHFRVPDFQPETPDGIESNDWLMTARKQSWEVELGIDPSTVNYVWLRHRPSGGRVFEILCPLSDEHEGWRGLSWLEYGYNQKEYRDSLNNYEESQLRDIRAWARKTMEATHRHAASLTDNAREGLTNAMQVAGTGVRRANEMALNEASTKELILTGGEFFDEQQWGSK